MPVIEEIVEDVVEEQRKDAKEREAPAEVPSANRPAERESDAQGDDANNDTNNNESGEFVFVSRGPSPAQTGDGNESVEDDGCEGGDSFVDAVESIPDADLLSQAVSLKEEGNGHYARGEFDLALEAYRAGINICPDRQCALRDAAAAGGGDDGGDGGETVAAEPYEPDEYSKTIAVLHSNTAAVLVKLEQWADCVASCNEALRFDPGHVKSHVRLCVAMEKLEDPPGLVSALKALEAAGGYGNPQELRKRISAVEKAAEAHREKEAAEMLDKLKGLGNTILGKFGMSLDNFVSEKREDGTYNIQFKQG